jgi:heterodisulfide reductase subunit A-like polyferredoxin
LYSHRERERYTEKAKKLLRVAIKKIKKMNQYYMRRKETERKIEI